MGFDTTITALKHLDVYRDGGSVGASFVGANEIEYCLFFGIRPPADRHPVRFEPPVLQWFCPYVYRSPVTGDVSPPMWREDSEPVGWSEALQILNELAPFVADGPSERKWIFDEMVQAAMKAAPG